MKKNINKFYTNPNQVYKNESESLYYQRAFNRVMNITNNTILNTLFH